MAVGLPVSRWTETLAWYEEVLGCRPVRVDVSNGEVVEMRFGSRRFSLWLDWGDPRAPRAAECVRAPILVLGVKSVTRAKRQLELRGAKVERTRSGLFFQVSDPEGNTIVLADEPRRVPPAPESRPDPRVSATNG